MKTKTAILVIIGILLASCAPATATQEIEVSTEAPATEAPMTQESVVTEEPVATEQLTELPTEAPTKPPLACVTLLAPNNGAEIPAVGKITFSWTPMDEARSYVLNIILPSGDTVSFETDQTFRDRYMESFIAGGEYQWQVIAQNTDGGEICISEVSTFNKTAFEKPKGGNDSGSGGGGDGGSSGGGNKPPTGPG